MRSILTGEIPVPDRCHCCASDKIRKAIVREEKQAWICDDCGAFVTCHDGTENPVGYMAGKKTRTLRKKAHFVFDRLWLERLMSRDKAYLWLAVALGLNPNDAHISWLTDEQLNKSIEISQDFYENSAEALLRRKLKNDEKRNKRHARQNAEQRRKIADRKRNNRP
jgi:hypothetical protein